MLFRILQHALDGREREAIAWLKKRHRTKPFFMNYWQFSVHAPFGAKPELTGYYHTKIVRGENTDRGPMFTHVPGHGNTPQWLPPSTSVHDGAWKLIPNYHYGDNGKHEYRLYNLREYIGENEAFAPVHLERVSFDPASFDPSKIGVQARGLNMPRSSKSAQRTPDAGKSAKTAMLGWIARSTEATLEGHSLQLSPAGGQPFITNAKVRVNGPVEVRLRIRAEKANRPTQVALRRPSSFIHNSILNNSVLLPEFFQQKASR
jgi:hypothetical protein